MNYSIKEINSMMGKKSIYGIDFSDTKYRIIKVKKHSGGTLGKTRQTGKWVVLKEVII